MPDYVLPMIVGGLFGLFLFLSGLADPDKIVGALRLKDFHAFRVMAVFLLVGMLGTWVLSLGGWANLDIKPAMMLNAALGGALLGIGFGLTGYCPGTGLACAAAGRIDALVTVIGMLFGALVFILIHPLVVPHMEKVANYGKITIPEHFDLNPAIFVWPIVVVGGGLLWLTRPRKPKAPSYAAPAVQPAPQRPAPAPAAVAPTPAETPAAAPAQAPRAEAPKAEEPAEPAESDRPAGSSGPTQPERPTSLVPASRPTTPGVLGGAERPAAPPEAAEEESEGPAGAEESGEGEAVNEEEERDEV